MKREVLYIKLVLIFNLLFCVVIKAQEKYLLKEDEMTDYNLISVINTIWPISDDSLQTNVIEQRWKSSDNFSYYIDYCEFESELAAIKGTAYMANSYSLPARFGSSSGILGDASWESLDGSFICLQKWNVGIKINNMDDDPKSSIKYTNFLNKILTRINDSVSDEILALENILKTSQLPFEEYENYTRACSTLLNNVGYSENSPLSTKWLLHDDSLVMGYRKQWSKEQSIISIDIAKYNNIIDCQNAVKCRGKYNFNIIICLNENIDSVYRAIDEWFTRWPNSDSSKFFFIAWSKENYSININYSNELGINKEFLKYMISVLGTETSIEQIKDNIFITYPNPTKDFLYIKINNNTTKQCSLIDCSGQLLDNYYLEIGNNLINISNYKPGMYFVQLNSIMGIITKKIIIQ
jgi:hypothetical protein